VLIKKSKQISYGAVRKTDVTDFHFPEVAQGMLEFNESRSLLSHLGLIQSPLAIKRCQSLSWGAVCCLALVASLKYNFHCTKRKIWRMLHTPHLPRPMHLHTIEYSAILTGCNQAACKIAQVFRSANVQLLSLLRQNQYA